MLKLKGNDPEILDVRLSEILNQIEDIDKYLWRLIWIEGAGTKKYNWFELDEKVNDSPKGISITPKELYEMDESFDQIIEIIVIGFKEEPSLPGYRDDDIMRKECDFFLELVDSSYWEITSKDCSFIDNIKKNFLFEEV